MHGPDDIKIAFFCICFGFACPTAFINTICKHGFSETISNPVIWFFNILWMIMILGISRIGWEKYQWYHQEKMLAKIKRS